MNEIDIHINVLLTKQFKNIYNYKYTLCTANLLYALFRARLFLCCLQWNEHYIHNWL